MHFGNVRHSKENSNQSTNDITMEFLHFSLFTRISLHFGRNETTPYVYSVNCKHNLNFDNSIFPL